jgi:hypothetical protein
MAEHTPGEWFIEPGNDGDDSVGLRPTPPMIFAVSREGSKVFPICTMERPSHRVRRNPTDPFDECVEESGSLDANAHLISASPDLLEAHEPERAGPDFLDWIADRLVEVHGESPDVDFVIALRRRAAKARAAIAKAEGRTDG